MKLSFLNLILAILLVLNIFIFHFSILGVILGLGFIILSSWLLGQLLAPGQGGSSQETGANIILFGFLLFLCAVILPLTIVYYFYQLNNCIIAGFLILLSLFVILSGVTRRVTESKDPLNVKKEIVLTLSKFKRFLHFTPLTTLHSVSVVSVGMTKRDIFSVLIYFILLVVSYFLLKSGVTLEPVRAPWHFVSKWFFVFYFLSTAVLIYLTTKLKTIHSLILSSIHLFFTFSIANIIFPLGFGFDPFIHQATEKYILENGFILPKPFYYLGQYSLVVFLTKIFQISHVLIDKNLVPALAAILLPSAIYYSFKKLTTNNQQLTIKNNKNSLFIIHYSLFLFLFIPFTIFTFTTPQNLADLLVIIIAFFGLGFILDKNKKLPIAYCLLPITILAIHPIAGLAAIIFVLVLWLSKIEHSIVVPKGLSWWPLIKKTIYVFLCFSVFCVFVLFSFISPLYKVDVVNNFNLVDFYNNIFRWSPDLFLNTNFVHLLKTIAYFFYTPVVLFLIIFLLAIIGLCKFRKERGSASLERGSASFLQLPLTFLILIINSIFLYSLIDFPFLIDYEKGDFAYRIFVLSTFFLIPLAIIGALSLLSFLRKQESSGLNFRIPCQTRDDKNESLGDKKRIFFLWIIVLLIAGGITTSLYFSYPRDDVYYYTRGFNTSIYDFNVIKYLEDITNEDYVVLANQQAGAGALFTFGFRYFDNKYFFYSIPTGGDLYQIYWKIVYENAGREEIKKASDLTGVKIVYVYFPDYWFNLKKLAPSLTLEADETMILENGKVWVFKFEF